MPQALEQTRRAHDLERERADSLEKKAIAVVTLCLSLLATALVLGGYQLGYLRRHHSSSWWLLGPAAASIFCLALAAIGALEVQRVGIYFWEGAEPLGRQPGGLLGLVQAEETGRRLAAGTALHKANGFLQARAWLSRALVALILSAMVTIGMTTNPTAPVQQGRVTTPRTSSRTRPASSASTTTLDGTGTPVGPVARTFEAWLQGRQATSRIASDRKIAGYRDDMASWATLPAPEGPGPAWDHSAAVDQSLGRSL